MKLSEIFSGVSKRTNPNKEVQDTGRQSSSTERINKHIKSLTPGKVVQGEVVSKSGNEVQIKLSEDITLTARLDKDVNVEEGKILTFEVKNNGKSLSLSPLFANTAMADNVFKALQMANLPVNNTTVTMTDAMMQRGMSIDSNSLQAMFKEVMTNPGADASNVVQLKQMGLPINEANLGQLENYKALTHQLVKGMTDVLQELPVAFQEIATASGTEKAVQMYQELLVKLLPEISVSNSNDTIGIHATSLAEGSVSGDGAAQIVAQNTEIMSNTGEGSGQILIPENGQPASVTEGTNILQTAPQESENSVEIVLSSQERAEFAELLKLIPGESSTDINQLAESVQNGTADINVILKTLSGVQNSAGETSGLSEVFRSSGFKKLFEHAMLKEWSIEPAQVADAEKVKELYSKLEKSLETIQNTLTDHGASQSAAMKSAGNMSQNLDFMNQMNQMYTYVQLPLQMQEGHTNGELYVYTNKRSLAQKDGNISAFLHLDMEHLGPVDVYVAMQNERVSTHFTLADDELLDFLNSHMHILTERLAKKGYTTSVEMKVKGESEEETNPIDRMMQVDKNTTILKQYAFDVRA